MGEIGEALTESVRGAVRDDAYTRHLYAADASMYAIDPLVVVAPRDAGDIAATIAVARRFDAPVIARGAGTSLAGQTAGGAGIVLDCSRYMDHIGAIDAAGRRVRVGPGAVQEQLNRVARPHGLVFGPDTSTANRATVGGMIGNNSSGSQSILYGTTRDHVYELDVVLADGSRARLAQLDPGRRGDSLEARIHRGLAELLDRHASAIATGYPRHWRQSGGYRLDALATDRSLARFICGTEGTLVTVCEAELGLVELPAATGFAVGHFESVDAALAATADALALAPASVELLDRTILDLSREKIAFRELAEQHIEGNPGALLFVAFNDGDDEAIAARLGELEERWARNGHGYHTRRATTARQRDALTSVRKAALGLLMAASDGAQRPLAFIEDTAVAPEMLGDYVRELRAILDRHELTAGFYGHASVGCLHIRPFLDVTRPGAIETLETVADEVVELVVRYDGVISSEHGDGRVRSPFNPQIFGEELYGDGGR